MKRDMGNQNQESIQKVITKLNNTFDSLNQFSEDLDRKISNLELLMSKASIVIENGQSKISSITPEYEVQQAQISQVEVAGISKVLDGKSNEIDRLETDIVESLQEIFTCSKSQLAYNTKIHKGISELQM
jgi:predicted  nucleic acid-binding Zn-ribbon protein